MRRFLLSNGYISVCITICEVMFLSLAVSGCKKDFTEREQENHIVNAIRRSVENLRLPPEARNRANLAIVKWENGILDGEPILISAILTRPEWVDEIDLALTVYDENKDVIGFGIKEEHIQPSGEQEIVEEIYPAFIHCPLYKVANTWCVTPLDIRTSIQRKDEQLWQKFVDNILISQTYESGRERLKKDDSNTSSSIPEALLWSTTATFPPVVVSIPIPNRVDVWVWVYDKAGNKSEPVKLLSYLEESY